MEIFVDGYSHQVQACQSPHAFLEGLPSVLNSDYFSGDEGEEI